MDIRPLPLTRLVPRPDARLVDDEFVADLARSIGDVGLLQPPRVRAKDAFYEVTAGWHRVLAAREGRLDTIECVVVNEDDLSAEAASLDENLVRHGLSRAELEIALARRKEIYERQHPEATKGRLQAAGMNAARGANVTDESSPTFGQKFGPALGRHPDTVVRMAKRGAKLNHWAVQLLKDNKSPLADDNGFLTLLASKTKDQQLRAVNKALAAERPKRPSNGNSIDKAWSALSADSKRAFVERHHHEILTLL